MELASLFLPAPVAITPASAAQHGMPFLLNRSSGLSGGVCRWVGLGNLGHRLARAGRIPAENPSGALITKTCQVAKTPDARVHGDDGEYDEDP
ncbi:hypothetical protein [Kitasatospora sp. NPDC057015]|uniref:hypothetical protein n=1 Tax=Kitasatospora sp. NPDC057015 TaxID=3346001 RepID=UPI003634F5BF